MFIIYEDIRADIQVMFNLCISRVSFVCAFAFKSSRSSIALAVYNDTLSYEINSIIKDNYKKLRRHKNENCNFRISSH